MRRRDQVNLTIDKGADVAITLKFYTRNADGSAGDPIDLTSCSGKLVAKKAYDDVTKVIELATSPGSGLTIPGTGGTNSVTITMARTATKLLEAGELKYELEVTSAGGAIRTRRADGIITITPRCNDE